MSYESTCRTCHLSLFCLARGKPKGYRCSGCHTVMGSGKRWVNFAIPMDCPEIQETGLTYCHFCIQESDDA